MRFSYLAVWLVFGQACYNIDRPPQEFKLARESIDLGTVSYLDETFPSGEFSLLNSGGIELLVTPVGFEGSGSAYLEIPTGLDYTPVGLEESMTFLVSLQTNFTSWDQGTYAPELLLEVASMWDDPKEWGEDVDWQSEEVRTTVSFTLNCDLDGDSFEAEDCGGEDCDDNDPATYPGAEEIEDSVDNDCDGYADSGSIQSQHHFTASNLHPSTTRTSGNSAMKHGVANLIRL